MERRKLPFVWFAVWEKPSVWFAVCEEKTFCLVCCLRKTFRLVCCLWEKEPSVWFAVCEEKTFCLAGCLCENWCLAGCLCENWCLWCWCRLWTKVSLWELVYVNLGRKIVLMNDGVVMLVILWWICACNCCKARVELFVCGEIVFLFRFFGIEFSVL